MRHCCEAILGTYLLAFWLGISMAGTAIPMTIAMLPKFTTPVVGGVQVESVRRLTFAV